MEIANTYLKNQAKSILIELTLNGYSSIFNFCTHVYPLNVMDKLLAELRELAEEHDQNLEVDFLIKLTPRENDTTTDKN